MKRPKKRKSTSNSLHSFEDDSKLYIFQNNEAMLKMMTKGRSPFMRHVSRTQRITLDLIFDRINVGPKIQIRYVDIENQLENILTKGSFSEYEWNNLLRLKNIMTVCTFPPSHFSHLVSDFSKNSRSMSKRGQEQNFAQGSAVTNQSQLAPYRSRPDQ